MTTWHPVRTELELTASQLRAIDRLNRARQSAHQAAAATTASREMRMDVDRRLEVLRAQHAAVVARTEEQLRRSAALRRRTVPPRALVAHRHAWFVGKVTDQLRERGVDVLAQFDNGAEVIGAAVAEQPDLVLVGDHLAMLSGEEVVREVRQYVPDCLIAAQVAHDHGIAPVLEAGATTAYTRRVPPVDLCADLARLLLVEAPAGTGTAT